MIIGYLYILMVLSMFDPVTLSFYFTNLFNVLVIFGLTSSVFILIRILPTYITFGILLFIAFMFSYILIQVDIHS